jgi:acyl carrier protein
MAFQREVFSRVCVMLAEVLNVDEGDIKPTCRLQADLGAESIDFMDIVFRLEREFDIRISRDELFPEFLLGDPECVQDGRFTPRGIGKLRARLPFADLKEFERDPQAEHISDLFTVELIIRYVQAKLAEKYESATAGVADTAGHPR